MMNNVTSLYCDLNSFSKKYEDIHGPLSFVVCVFGSIANVLNICVLTTKDMRWPTNLILTGLAIADLLVMLEYIPFTIHRYINVEVTYLICPLICTPLFISLKIVTYNQTCDKFGRILDKKDLLNYTEVSTKRQIYIIDYVSEDYKYMSFWIYGVVIKLVPCILLTHLSRKLIVVLLETKRRRKTLLSSSIPMEESYDVRPFLQKKFEKYRQADRTSGMLVAILLLFLITEFPQAIMGLLMATKGQQFEKECYRPLGDIMDILALTNSGINFILYCTMSRQFRITFKEIFLIPIINQFAPDSHYCTIDKSGEKTQISAV
ncbi:unnamed protein product [Ceutorhynchus assimilis]|uniref:G-protein coupled receptors family 1 profile domain-containing protein n=1 Tax=Ceutorhynchus assimilis TaxID=467358 RepID=A0A9N9QK86_9CUCU|nr:unnamed protein product [Ceutorhynchus assimilis]